MKRSAGIILGTLALLALLPCPVDAFRSPGAIISPVEHAHSTLTTSGQSFGSNPQVCWTS
jgi:hypothetical protein